MKTLESRIIAKSLPEPNTGCWLWLGSVYRDGYGQIGVRARKFRAHRASYEVFVKPIPDGLQLDHLCRVRSCVNPKHLEPVTNQENLRRGLGGRPGGLASGAIKKAFTHCGRGHEFNEANTRIRKNGTRKCRTCERITLAARRAK